MKKTNDQEAQIAAYREEMDLDRAEVREGARHGTVVSVRLDPDEAERLRSLAESLDLNLSQVLRRALRAFGGERGPTQPPLVASAWVQTLGGTDWQGKMVFHGPPQLVFGQVGTPLQPVDTSEEPRSATFGAHIRERILSGSS